MGTLGYIYRTFSRLRAGKGFGVHSPFAFMFIKDVLRLSDRYAYYPYPRIAYLHSVACNNDSGYIPLRLKYLKMIFRVGVYYNFRKSLLIGGSEPLVALTLDMLGSDLTQGVMESDPEILNQELYRDFSMRLVKDSEEAVEFLKDSGTRPLVVITDAGVVKDADLLFSELQPLEPVYVITGLKRNRRIWERLTAHYPYYGMSFSNPHVGVFIPDKGLPRQHFNIWL